jgi:hypothetical protein
MTITLGRIVVAIASPGLAMLWCKTAEVNLLQGTTFKKVAAKLD